MTIRPAVPADVAEITAIIHELAAFERAPDECTVTTAQMTKALFSDVPTARALVAEVDGQIAGAAVWFVSFSTWDGEAGIYLEDLFVRKAFRRRGLARALLAELARMCTDAGYTRLSWAVLNWNVDAIALYDAVGAEPQSEWTTYRLSGPGLSALSSSR